MPSQQGDKTDRRKSHKLRTLLIVATISIVVNFFRPKNIEFSDLVIFLLVYTL